MSFIQRDRARTETRNRAFGLVIECVVCGHCDGDSKRPVVWDDGIARADGVCGCGGSGGWWVGFFSGAELFLGWLVLTPCQGGPPKSGGAKLFVLSVSGFGPLEGGGVGFDVEVVWMRCCCGCGGVGGVGVLGLLL